RARAARPRWADVRRSPAELPEVGVALLGEGGDALARLVAVHEQVEPGERQRADAGDRLAVGVERVLEEAQRGGTLLEDLVGPAAQLGAQLAARHDGVHQAPLEHRA